MTIACPCRHRGTRGKARGARYERERQEEVSYVIILYISLTALISIIHKAFCTNFGSTSPPSENSARRDPLPSQPFLVPPYAPSTCARTSKASALVRAAGESAVGASCGGNGWWVPA